MMTQYQIEYQKFKSMKRDYPTASKLIMMYLGKFY